MVLEKVSSPDTRILNMINSTDHGNGTGTHAFAQDAKPASALNKSWSDENIIKFPTKCRGSALCPDYDYYPSSFWDAWFILVSRRPSYIYD